MVVSVTDDTVTLSWMEPDPTNGIITEYQLQYTRCSQPNLQLTAVRDISTLTHTVDGLVVNTEYCFRVRALTSVGIGPWTTSAMARTC